MKAWIATQLHEVGRTVTSAFQVHSQRREIVLRLESRGVVGIGLVSPQPDSLLGDASFQSVWERLTGNGLRRVLEADRQRDGLRWWQVSSLFGSDASDRAVSALCESAVLDLECQGSPQQWASTLGEGECAAQWTVSLADTEWNIPAGVSRVRVKFDATRPWDWSRLAEIDVPILLDANGSTADEDSIVEAWNRAREFGALHAVEQAWGVGDFVTPSQLRQREVTTSHDESIRSVLDVRRAVQYESADVLCLKTLRLGGIAALRQCASTAREAGIETYVGGFFESPLGRFRNDVLARSLNAGPSDILSMQGTRVTEQDALSAWSQLDRHALGEGELVEIHR